MELLNKKELELKSRKFSVYTHCKNLYHVSEKNTKDAAEQTFDKETVRSVRH